LALANGLDRAFAEHPELIAGVNVSGGVVTNEAVADFLDADYIPPLQALGLTD
jgi:alanine dehydrogenase